MTNPRDKKSIRLQATKTGINLSIDLPRLMLEILSERVLNTVIENGRTLRETLEEIANDPLRNALEDKTHPVN